MWLPAFQMPMLAKCDAVPNEICGTCLFSGIHSRHSFWQFPGSCSTLYQLCIMLALCLQKIPSLCRRFRICVICRKAWVWSRSCGLQGLLPNIGMFFFFHLPCRLSKCVGIELLATVGWKWGCQPFTCRCLQNVMCYGKDIFSTCSSRESI